MSSPTDDYVALFCPHCGAHVNEDELESDDETAPDPGSRSGPSYTCGWCGVRTSDWNHVIRCRASHRNLEQMRENGRVVDLLALRDELAEQ